MRGAKPDLDAIRRLVQDTLDKSATGNAEFETIMLKHAKAPDAAKALEQTFTDPKTGIIRVRVAADAGSNSLLVRGSPQDLQVLRRLVQDTIDQPGVSESEVETYPLKNAVATDAAKLLEAGIHRYQNGDQPRPDRRGCRLQRPRDPRQQA